MCGDCVLRLQRHRDAVEVAFTARHVRKSGFACGRLAGYDTRLAVATEELEIPDRSCPFRLLSWRRNVRLMG